jgi:acyl carrier protein
MAAEDVLDQVRSTLAEVLGAEEGDIRPEATLLGDLEASSLDIVDLLFQLKRKFGIELTLQQVQQQLGGGDGDGSNGEGGQGFNDSLFERVTVADVAHWVGGRLAA